MKINSDGFDVYLKLHSSLRITLDMSACMSDNKIKNCITL